MCLRDSQRAVVSVNQMIDTEVHKVSIRARRFWAPAVIKIRKKSSLNHNDKNYTQQTLPTPLPQIRKSWVEAAEKVHPHPIHQPPPNSQTPY